MEQHDVGDGAGQCAAQSSQDEIRISRSDFAMLVKELRDLNQWLRDNVPAKTVVSQVVQPDLGRTAVDNDADDNNITGGAEECWTHEQVHQAASVFQSRLPSTRKFAVLRDQFITVVFPSRSFSQPRKEPLFDGAIVNQWSDPYKRGRKILQLGLHFEVTPSDLRLKVDRNCPVESEIPPGSLRLVWDFSTRFSSGRLVAAKKVQDRVKHIWPADLWLYEDERVQWKLSSTNFYMVSFQKMNILHCSQQKLHSPASRYWNSWRHTLPADMPLSEDFSSKQVLGKSWIISCFDGEGILNISSIAFIWSILDISSIREDEFRGFSDPGVHRFLKSFCGRWEFSEMEKAGVSELSRKARVPGSIDFVFHLRLYAYSTIWTDTIKRERTEHEGLEILRDQGTFKFVPGFIPRSKRFRHGDTFDITERRISIIIRATWGSNLVPLVSTAILTDLSSVPSFESDQRSMILYGHTSYLEAYQRSVAAAFKEWESAWHHTLAAIESIVSITFADLKNRRKELMYDNNLKRSELYFTTLHLLRIFSKTIRDAIDDLKKLEPLFDCLASTRDKDRKRLHDSWVHLVELNEHREANFQRRIAKLQDDIQAMRDSVFTATSVLETSKSSTMGRYVMIVTIVTIIYLPPTLTATVFGMSIWDNITPDPSRLVTYYQWSTVCLGIITYGGSFLLILLVGKRIDLAFYWRGMKTSYRKASGWYWTGAQKEEKWKEYLEGDPEGKKVHRREDEESRPGRVSTVSSSYTYSYP